MAAPAPLYIESHYAPGSAPDFAARGFAPVISLKRPWLSQVDPAAVAAFTGPVIVDDERTAPAEDATRWSRKAVNAMLAESAHVRRAAKSRPKSRRGPGVGWYGAVPLGERHDPLDPVTGEPVRRACAALAWGGVYAHYDFVAVCCYPFYSGGNTDADLIYRWDCDFAHTLSIVRDVIRRPAVAYLSDRFMGELDRTSPAVWAHACRRACEAVRAGELLGVCWFGGWHKTGGAQAFTPADADALAALRAAAAP